MCAWHLTAGCEFVEFVVVEHSGQPVQVPERAADLIGQLAAQAARAPARRVGKCVVCGSTVNLHFDHIIPYSRGGSSLVAENIQLMCARHNLAKHDKIQ